MDLKIYTISEITQIKDNWLSLEAGYDMTYFQTYDWNRMLTRIYEESNFKYEVIFCVVNNNHKPVLIAPLIIYRHTHGFINRKGFYFFGRKGWSDYLNFIYDKFDKVSVDYLFDELRFRYGVNSFYFEQVRSNTDFYKYLVDKRMIRKTSVVEYVKLDLPNTVEIYNKLLSKHSRQNIRTAKNRSEKAGVSFTINYDDKDVDLVVCKQIRESRVNEKLAKEYHSKSLLKKIKFKIWKKLEDKYPPFLPFYDDENSKMLTIYDNDVLCGFFNYGVDKYHSTILLMAVGTNDNYARYSPGLHALYSFICSKIEEGEISCIDFTRGNEPYKYALGGCDSHCLNLQIKFDSK